MAPTMENDARAASARAAHQEEGEDDPSSTTTAASASDDSADSDDPQQQQQQQEQQQDDQEWDEWGGDEDDADSENDAEESDRTRSLFDPPTAPPLPSPEAALAHDAQVHGFDLRVWRRRCKLDQYGVIRAVNWARKCVAEGEDPRPALRAYEEAVVAGGDGKHVPLPAWSGDEFLVPALPDDPLVTYDYEEDEEDGDAEEQATTSAAAAPTAGADTDPQQLTIQRLAAENAALRTRLQALVEATLPEELRAESTLLQGGAAAKEQEEDAPKPATPANPKPTSSAAALIDAAYFDSYSHFDIHREMLSDVPRTQAYRDALEKNPSLTKGASVVDVGAGTGVLSLFAAKGGQAASVVGIEGSARMARIAGAVAEANGLSRDANGGPVTIVSGRVEALVAEGEGEGDDATPTKNSLLPTPNSADVLVSEWMGYALLFESMLSSVLTARDAWLKPGGAVLPDVARVIVAGADLRTALGCGFWDDVYGLKMTPIGDEVVDGVVGLGGGGSSSEGKEEKEQPKRRPPRLLVRQVPASALRTTSAQVRELDLATMSHDDQDFTAEFECGLSGVVGLDGAEATATTTPTTATTKITCLVLWFDTLFTERFCRDCPVVLSTAPTSAPTHWAQAVLPLSRPVELGAPSSSSSSSSSSSLRGRLSMARRRGRHRALDISVEYWVDGSSSSKAVVDLYSMGVNQDEEELLAEGAEKEDDGAPRPEATIA
jgi:protein arginine N-methyltransferase 3